MQELEDRNDIADAEAALREHREHGDSIPFEEIKATYGFYMTGSRFRAEITVNAQRHIRHLQPRLRERILNRVEALGDDPRPPGVTKLAGTDDFYRICIGNYRAIYIIEDVVLLVLVVSIGHRKDIYRDV